MQRQVHSVRRTWIRLYSRVKGKACQDVRFCPNRKLVLRELGESGVRKEYLQHVPHSLGCLLGSSDVQMVFSD